MSSDLHVVIGASGGTGAAVVRELAARGHRARGVSRTAPPSLPGVEHLAADAGDQAALLDAARGATVIYQCANPPYAEWPSTFPVLQNNAIAAAEVTGARLVMADNLYMYGPEASQPLRESTPMLATGKKGMLRARMASQLLEAHDAGRVQVAIGRSSDYFGPGGTNSAVGQLFFGPAGRGKGVRWLGRLDQPHALSFLPDTARGLVTLGENESAAGRAWHLPIAATLTAEQWRDLLSQRMGRPIKLSGLSRSMLRLAGLFVPVTRELGETLYQWERPWVVDDSEFRRTFGGEPTPVERAIDEAMDWYVKAGRHSARN